MPTSPIYIVSPANIVTGGPELLHQLAHVLNRLGQPAAMLYHPFDKSYETPEPFRRYGVRSALLGEVEPGSGVVLPEIYSALLGRFDHCPIYFWWLSVDNFVVSIRGSRLAHIIGKRALMAVRLWRLRTKVAVHLYQSEYARLYLARHALAPNRFLSDYLADEYLECVERPRAQPREDLVVYNPAKGKDQAAAIEQALNEKSGDSVRMVPIRNMTREEVKDLLSRAKVYIDFGNHPGKDRIPREAAALGACVVVNRRGSAANEIDLPVPSFYKVDDSKPGYAEMAVSRILAIISDFETHQAAFDPYRSSIIGEQARFVKDARSIFLP